jgi:thioredoxin 2
MTSEFSSLRSSWVPELDSVEIVRLACNTINRVPNARLQDKPKCGHCGKPIFEGHPASAAGKPLQMQIERTSISLLIHVWATWCGPCKAMAPHFERAAAALEPRFRLLKVDIDQAPDLAQHFGIRSVPALLLLKNGKEVARTAGATDTQQIQRWAEQAAAAQGV